MFGFNKQQEDAQLPPPAPGATSPVTEAAPSFNEPTFAPPPEPAPRNEAPAPTPTPIAKLSSGTRIGEDTRVEGNIRTRSPLSIAGEVVGNVVGEAEVIVEADARVHGDLSGADVIIRGEVQGSTSAAGKLTISSSGTVLGDISVRSLLIEDGGTLQGQCQMNSGAAVQTLPPPPQRKVDNGDEDDDADLAQLLPPLQATGN